VTIPRIYLPRPLETGDVCAIAADQARYLIAVLRMREGDPLLVFNGSGREYEAAIRQATDEETTLVITGARNAPAGLIEITLCQAIPKADKMESIVRQATELGADRIVPFFAKRSVPRWPAEKSPRKRARWQKIASEAARQCGRTDIPEIGEIATFEQMLLSARPEGLNLIFWEEESAAGVREVLRDPQQAARGAFVLIIGPEGGFDKSEIDLARQAGFISVSLGERVLRVDTAAAAVLAVIQYERGFLGDTS